MEFISLAHGNFEQKSFFFAYDNITFELYLNLLTCQLTHQTHEMELEHFEVGWAFSTSLRSNDPS